MEESVTTPRDDGLCIMVTRQNEEITKVHFISQAESGAFFTCTFSAQEYCEMVNDYIKPIAKEIERQKS